MKIEEHNFVIRNPKAPVVEVDTEAMAVYIRFSNKKVARTIPRESNAMIIAVDLDSAGEVIGIEAVGIKEFGITKLVEVVKKASGRNVDFMKSRFIPAGMAA